MTSTEIFRRSSHGWNHRICGPCWVGRRGSTNPPRVRPAPWENCCFCGRDTNAGIYLRARPGTEEISRCSDNPQSDYHLFFANL